MLRSELKNEATWMVQSSREPFKGYDIKLEEMLKMFGSKISSSKSTFYTDLEEVNNDEPILTPTADKQSIQNPNCLEPQSGSNEDVTPQDSNPAEKTHFPRHSFYSITNIAGFPRFRPFVMSTSTSSVEVTSSHQTSVESSLVKISQGLLDYTNTRYFFELLDNLFLQVYILLFKFKF